MGIVMKIMLALVTILLAAGCSPQSQVVGKDGNRNNAPVVQVSHFVTQDGLECVQKGIGKRSSISCNWEKYNHEKRNGRL